MGEISLLIKRIQEDKNEFNELMERMTPLINKYTRILYKDEKEDIYSEMVLALWEAVTKLKYYNDDGKCMTFLCTALRNKFLELYKKSKKFHDYNSNVDITQLPEEYRTDEKYSNIIFLTDLEQVLLHLDQQKKDIYREIIYTDISDAELGYKYNISRQYANRLRRNIYQLIKEKYMDMGRRAK